VEIDLATRRLIDRVPHDVKELFEQLVLKLIRDGWEHYSSDAILHRIRWHMRVDRNIRDFKCNNNWTAYLARWFADRHPEHGDFFRFRTLGVDHHDRTFFADQ
jgi:hypothetical protein